MFVAKIFLLGFGLVLLSQWCPAQVYNGFDPTTYSDESDQPSEDLSNQGQLLPSSLSVLRSLVAKRQQMRQMVDFKNTEKPQGRPLYMSGVVYMKPMTEGRWLHDLYNKSEPHCNLIELWKIFRDRCMSGFHRPSNLPKEELLDLLFYLGGSYANNEKNNFLYPKHIENMTKIESHKEIFRNFHNKVAECCLNPTVSSRGLVCHTWNDFSNIVDNLCSGSVIQTGKH